MIEWWGPIISEFYSATEANGYCRMTAREWLQKPGTVGKPVTGEIHITDEDGNEVPVNTPGTIYFGAGGQFEYHNDPEKTKAKRQS
jgi:long-chain acyl-CoA synthetase